jgi:prophage antirepressor-like protein
MREIQMFKFEETSVRTVERPDGSVWFVAADVCTALTITNARDAVSRLDDDEHDLVIADTLGGSQETSVISESGLYSLILTSRKPEAKRFKKWVTSEVLPSLRKTGAYGVADAILNPMVDRLINVIEKQADTMARMYEATVAKGESFDLTSAKASARRQIIRKELEGRGLDLDEFASKTGLTRKRVLSDIHVIRQKVALVTHRDGERVRYTVMH